MQPTFAQVRAQAEKITFRNQPFIDGQYVAPMSGAIFECRNPATGEILTRVAACDHNDVDKAVDAARRSFVSGSWAKLSPTQRKKILLKLADLVEKNHLELAVLETLDMGKPIKNSLEDVSHAIALIRWYAELLDKIYDKIAPTATNVLALITHEPVGVVGAVTPWNFPLWLACSKLAPALAAGNSVVLKPAEQSPLTALYLAELTCLAGIPDGVVNVVPGFGEPAGRAIGLHCDIDVVSFTGSTDVGKLFLHYSASSNMKYVALECGGKSPNIVLADYQDLDKAAQCAIDGVFFNQGEVCCATSRLLVAESIQEEFLEKLLHYSKAYQPGDPLDPATTMGAIVDNKQLKRILRYIQNGQEEGATLFLGGKQANVDSGGYFIEPTIFTQVSNSMSIAREEIFGPVLSILTFRDEMEAVAIANDTQYGLTASLWTNDINKAHKLARALRAGVVSVNCVNGGDITTPFGGYKQSGIGREGSLEGLQPYLETKTTWINLDESNVKF